jgi:hypothetical protein
MTLGIIPCSGGNHFQISSQRRGKMDMELYGIQSSIVMNCRINIIIVKGTNQQHKDWIGR